MLENVVLDENGKEELKEIVAIFMDLPSTERAILLHTAMGFKTLRRIENEDTKNKT